MRNKLGYALLVAVPAAAAIATAPAATADTPVCTGNQIPGNDNCVADTGQGGTSPSGGCDSLICLVARGDQDVYLTDLPEDGADQHTSTGGPDSEQDVNRSGNP